MTNETTASQPKSIGDDAQFLKLLTAVETAPRYSKALSEASAALIADIDSRAPAAQASATIQAIECGYDIGPERKAFYEGMRAVQSRLERIAKGWDGCNAHGIASGKGKDVGAWLRTEFAALDSLRNPGVPAATIQAAPPKPPTCHGIGFNSCCTDACAWKDEQYAATIQGPVMMADPVGETQTSAAIKAVHVDADHDDKTSELARRFISSKDRAYSRWPEDELIEKELFEALAERQSHYRVTVAAQLTNSTTLAAPMVADPAGVKWTGEQVLDILLKDSITDRAKMVLRNGDMMKFNLSNLTDFINIATTVKAVPSEALEIPNGVYFSASANNFYDMMTKTGMGGDFFKRWRGCSALFPQDDFRANRAGDLSQWVKLDAAPLADKTGGGE